MLLLVTMQPVIARNPEAPQLQGDFQWPKLRINNFAVDQAWRVDRHPRFLADVNDDDRADIVGFGDAGVYVSLATGSGNFNPIEFKLNNFGFDQGWRVDQHPRIMADVNNDDRADIIGFGDAGVYVSLATIVRP